MADSPFAKRAHACMQPLTSLFGGMYLGSLGMIVSPVSSACFFRGDISSMEGWLEGGAH